MSTAFFETPIEYLKGVGPKRADLLKKELKIFTFYDLLTFFPFRYVDKSKFYNINQINNDFTYVQLCGKIISIDTIGSNIRNQRLVAKLEDNTGIIELVWFKGLKWIKNSLTLNKEYIVFGKPNYFKNKFNITHPEIELKEAHNNSDFKETFQAFYFSTEKLKAKGLNSKGISKLIKTLCLSAKGIIPETLNEDIIKSLKLISREQALLNIHLPKNINLLKQAQRRLKFEELFFIQLQLLKQKLKTKQTVKGHKFLTVGKYFNNFYHNNLPFKLTNAQKRVIKEIRVDTGSGKQMNRLLQGDVGSGKTLVALMTMLIALDNNYQCCLMAPTEILANQHFNTITKMLEGINVNIALLTGSTKTTKRNEIYEQLLNKKLQILIGTHALIEDKVKFNNLGLVVIDEQHKFGVAQRAKLWEKNNIPPHVLVMTATPIPRTLAMTIYSDLDISVIDDLPPGRKSIKTYHFKDSDRLKVFGFMKRQILKGQQIYIVFPLIEESEKLDLKDLMDGYESIVREFPLPEYAVSIVHGRMKNQDKNFEMQRFIKGETQIMVATTVIEVGVDIPKASVMIIENAERFGLSQLHQLRGRVGRGADQAYCILMTKDKLSEDAAKRIKIMTSTNDGFIIAKADLELRGPGVFNGTQQSGVLNLKIADIVKDEKILIYSKKLALEILNDDIELHKPKYRPLAEHLAFINKNKTNWSVIS
ncbi:MAG: ATP-dependent DNA helicase RecG [Bacteroidales bacterium]|nr:ATP-dependent DNA helicase RecG [Bacteroidales bacterium]